MDRPAYYAIIPANVRYAKIPDGAKLLYGEITALSSKEGYCWASNSYFGGLYGVHPNTVSTWVQALKDSGFIAVVIHRNSLRKIMITPHEKQGGGFTKNVEGVHEKQGTSIKSITKENNTVATAPIVVEVSEDPPKTKSDPLVEKAARYWHSKCRDEVGQEPSGGLSKTMRVIKDARKSLSFSQIKQMIDAWFEEQTLEPHEMIQITRCLSLFQIDKFKAENV